MMNEPTNSDTAAKASRNVPKKLSDFLTSLACWAAATSLVTASRFCGSTGDSRSTSCARVTPPAAPGHPVHLADRLQQRGGHGPPVRLSRVLRRELLGGSDLGVGLAVDLGEEVVEGVGQGVGQHEGAGDEADAEHYRQGGERQP